MLKHRRLHRKQNQLSRAVSSLTWSYIYWTHTFPNSSWSLDRKLCHVVAVAFGVPHQKNKGFLTFPGVIEWAKMG